MHNMSFPAAHKASSSLLVPHLAALGGQFYKAHTREHPAQAPPAQSSRAQTPHLQSISPPREHRGNRPHRHSNSLVTSPGTWALKSKPLPAAPGQHSCPQMAVSPRNTLQAFASDPAWPLVSPSCAHQPPLLSAHHQARLLSQPLMTPGGPSTATPTRDKKQSSHTLGSSRPASQPALVRSQDAHSIQAPTGEYG